MDNVYLLIASIGIAAVFGGVIHWAIQLYIGRKAKGHSIKDQHDQPLYVHESHILMMPGLGHHVECLNCGGNPITLRNIKKLAVPCSMELSVYDGNNKFKHSTGETNV